MKLYISILFVFCILTTFAQNELKEVPKGTTKIIVKTERSTKDNFKTLLNVLLDYDFEIENKDSELFTIKTGQKPIPRTGSYYLNFMCKEDLIEITGKFYSGISMELNGVKSEDKQESITNKGMKNSIYKISFQEMFNVANLIGTNLSYN